MPILRSTPDYLSGSTEPSQDGQAIECHGAASMGEAADSNIVNLADIEWVQLVDVWNIDEMGFDEDDPERPMPISGVPKKSWDELCERVAAIRPSLVAGEAYGDGEICGGDWWLSLHWFTQYAVATCLRQPRFLAEHGLRVVAIPDTAAGGFELDCPQ